MPDSSAPRRPGWDEYFVNIARAVAERSDCRRRKVGAVLVDTGRRIVGTGYTGAPSGHPGCLEGACPRGLLSYDEVKEFSAYDSGPGRCISVHAEANALLARNHGVIASFSRALVDGLSAQQPDESFDADLDEAIQSIYEASLT